MKSSIVAAVLLLVAAGNLLAEDRKPGSIADSAARSAAAGATSPEPATGAATVTATGTAASDPAVTGTASGAEVEVCGGCVDPAAGNSTTTIQAPVAEATNPGGAPEMAGSATEPKPAAAPLPVPAQAPTQTLGTQSDLKAEPGVIVSGVISDFKPTPIKGLSPLRGINQR